MRLPLTGDGSIGTCNMTSLSSEHRPLQLIARDLEGPGRHCLRGAHLAVHVELGGRLVHEDGVAVPRLAAHDRWRRHAPVRSRARRGQRRHE